MVSLKGALGDYTSQSKQTGASDTFACGGAGTLNVDLVLADSVILDITDYTNTSAYRLDSGMDVFYTNGSSVSWKNGQTAYAANYFTSDALDLNQYTLSYEWATPNDASSGLLRITRTIPELTTATLALFSLAILRRRRRN